MADSEQSNHKEVKVEDLLRLKRAERPNEDFWNTFDRELHQRMLQTLVKKDPWYVQLLRGATGRIAQTVTVGAAAAFLAMMVVRPAFVDNSNTNNAGLAQDSSISPSATVEVAMSDLDESVTPDYQLETISSAEGLNYTADYSLDSFEVASYDSNAYVTDTASFAASGVATGLVY